MKEEKKSRRLLLQVSLVIIPLFLIMIGAVAVAMYKSTVDGFLKVQNESIDHTLDELYDKTCDFEDSYFLDFWEDHPADTLEENDALSEEEKKKILEDLMENGITKNKEFKNEIKNQPEEVQKYTAYVAYYLTVMGPALDETKKKYENMFLMDINSPNEGFIFFLFDQNGDGLELGEKIEFDISDHSVLEQLRESGSDKIVYEKTEDFIGNGNRYLGYKPVVFDGKVRAVLGVSYNWDEFSEIMTENLWKTLAFGIGCMIIVMVAVLVLLYRMAIKPVRKIQESVCEYIDTKDSVKVTDMMNTVKTNNEIGILSDNIAHLAREIERFTAENIKLAGEKERVAAELDMAREIQASQLPCIFPAFPDRKEFDIYASMTPAKEVGGDFYDFFFIDDDHLALVIADVSGKGIPASLFMMMTKILITDNAMMGLSPSEVLERTNESIWKNNDRQMFVTVWFGVLEISTGKVTAANAGHEYPIIRQPNGEFEIFKDKHGLVVGGLKKIKYKQYEFTLQKGSTLFVYTDGVPEATRADKEMFKVSRLVSTLNEHRDASPKELLESVRRAVDDFVGDEPQFDDLTMLGITLL